MAAENKIILITNESKVADILQPQLVLLRGIDSIAITNYAEAVKDIKNCSPDAIILHCGVEKQDCLNLIREIKADASIKNIVLLLVVSEYDQDFVLSAYDEEITDFFVLEANEAEVLMRIIWCMRKNTLMNAVNKQHGLLEDLNVINKETDYYTEEFCEKVLENEIKLLHEKNVEGVLMAVSASEDAKTKLNPAHFAKAIKSSTRASDIIAHAAGNKFYILLPKTSNQGAFCVWDKIKKNTGEDYFILAGLSDVKNKNFEQAKTEVLNSLIEAENTKTDLVIAEDSEKKNSDNWLSKIGTNQKNFKLFKQAFNKKLDKVIAPVFFQMQKMWEEKLFETKIEQSTNSTLSQFSLKKNGKESAIKITYPGFSKINIDVVHQGLDSPENKRISLDLTEFDENKLIGIIEDFIKEFKE